MYLCVRLENKERERGRERDQILLKKLTRIWLSEISLYYQTITHNTFAVSAVGLAFGIVDWFAEETCIIGIKTRKMLTFFRRVSGVMLLDRLRISEIRESPQIEPLLFHIEKPEL